MRLPPYQLTLASLLPSADFARSPHRVFCQVHSALRVRARARGTLREMLRGGNEVLNLKIFEKIGIFFGIFVKIP